MSALCSCSTNSGSKSSEHYIIDYPSLLEANESQANLSQYVSDIKYIPIETKSDVLISDVRTIAA
ncbi:MAG: 6-bladed beta-propeller, partial [Bacteroidales bacterium]|nr:6-bladed beta-propeller [Bacteroidales bacterium]